MTLLKAGETVYKVDKLPKTPLRYTTSYLTHSKNYCNYNKLFPRPSTHLGRGTRHTCNEHNVELQRDHGDETLGDFRVVMPE